LSVLKFPELLETEDRTAVAVFDGPGNFRSLAVLVQSSLGLFPVLGLDFQALDGREVAEMSGSRTAVGEDAAVHDMITLMDSEDVREAEMSGSCPFSTRVKYRTSGHTSCAGIHLSFLPGRKEHTSYIFGLHCQLLVPWNCHSIGGTFVLQAKNCREYWLRKNLHLLSRDNVELAI
jgi:hypothetical protein